MRVALVLGGGACVWSDIEAALKLGEFDGVVTCNDVTAAWPGRIDACASLHASSWPRWIAQRDRNGYPRPERIYGHLEGANSPKATELVTEYLQYRFPGQDHTGSSGLFALKVALIDLGFERAVLCGVPMTATERHFFDPKEWRGALSHQKGWVEALPQIVDRARSMSGWTAEMLGRPTPEWLAS
jgi:hypothetical protein